MFSLLVLLTVFLGLVGALVLLTALQNRWKSSQALAPLLLRAQVDKWLLNKDLHLPSPSQLIPVFNGRLREWLQEEERDLVAVSVEELLPQTEYPEIKVTKILSQTATSLSLECDVEWPMCVPGVGVRVIPGKSRDHVICHLQVEWMYAHAKVSLERSEDGLLLLSYAHTTAPMMGLSCGLPNQTLDDQESAKLSSSVADALQAVFNELNLQRVPIKEAALPAPSLPVDQLPVVTVSAPEEVIGSPDTPTASDSELSEPEPPLYSPSQLTKAPSVESSESEELDLLPNNVGVVSAGPEAIPVVTLDHPQEDEARPLSPRWRRSSSYEQLTNSLVEAPPNHSFEQNPKALTLSMVGSEAESLYGADNRIPSLLVFEIKDSAHVRHIVALSGPHAHKMRRNFSDAQKLHIYNDHCFIAVHLKEKVICVVCKQKISGLFGKQAYVCRGCDLTLHKHCHFKIESPCSKSQVQAMNLIYPTDVSTVHSS